MRPNPFIVFEGIDGSGKSTQAELLYSHLTGIGKPCRFLMEPSRGEWGTRIREMLSGSHTPPAEKQLELFLLDRQDDARTNILPAIEAGLSIVMDRYYFSNAAYQGAMGIDPEYIISENRKLGFPEPDRVYLIDISPESALERISRRNGERRDIFEKGEFLHRVRDIFMSIADSRFVIIDGEKEPDEVNRAIIEDFSSLIKQPEKRNT